MNIVGIFCLVVGVGARLPNDHAALKLEEESRTTFTYDWTDTDNKACTDTAEEEGAKLITAVGTIQGYVTSMATIATKINEIQGSATTVADIGTGLGSLDPKLTTSTDTEIATLEEGMTEIEALADKIAVLAATHFSTAKEITFYAAACSTDDKCMWYNPDLLEDGTAASAPKDEACYDFDNVAAYLYFSNIDRPDDSATFHLRALVPLLFFVVYY